MQKLKLKLPFKPVLALAIIFLALAFILGYIWNVVRNNGYFTVKAVVYAQAGQPSASPDLTYLIGRDIFSVNLKREANYLLDYFPECRRVRLVRMLPDRIYVDLIKRKSLALIKLYRYFNVDEEGMLFLPQAEPTSAQLPVITGLETKIFGPRPGKLYKVKELDLALQIIKEFKKNKILRNYRIKRLEAGNAAATSLYLPFSPKSIENAAARGVRLPESLEIKIGQDNLGEKINLLASLVTAAKGDLVNIKYIDIRFKEPVIKYNDLKPKQ